MGQRWIKAEHVNIVAAGNTSVLVPAGARFFSMQGQIQASALSPYGVCYLNSTITGSRAGSWGFLNPYCNPPQRAEIPPLCADGVSVPNRLVLINLDGVNAVDYFIQWYAD